MTGSSKNQAASGVSENILAVNPHQNNLSKGEDRKAQLITSLRGLRQQAEAI